MTVLRKCLAHFSSSKTPTPNKMYVCWWVSKAVFNLNTVKMHCLSVLSFPLSQLVETVSNLPLTCLCQRFLLVKRKVFFFHPHCHQMPTYMGFWNMTLCHWTSQSVLQVKENLLSCKMLLHCKRDELRKLWIEGIEHKHVLQLLDEIESIKQVPQRLETYMASKHYLHATDMLVSRVMAEDGIRRSVILCLNMCEIYSV